VLKEAWQAVAELSDTIKNEPESVWHYPNVIRQTLVEKDIEPDSLAGRAADEKVGNAAGVSLSSFLATGAGFIELIVLMAGAAPPVGAVVGVMATILSVPELMETYKNTQLQRAAYRAVLDPNKSLASDESYVEFIFGLLSLLPVFGDLRALRYAS
jgi:hypothetical protein